MLPRCRGVGHGWGVAEGSCIALHLRSHCNEFEAKRRRHRRRRRRRRRMLQYVKLTLQLPLPQKLQNFPKVFQKQIKREGGREMTLGRGQRERERVRVREREMEAAS